MRIKVADFIKVYFKASNEKIYLKIAFPKEGKVPAKQGDEDDRSCNFLSYTSSVTP